MKPVAIYLALFAAAAALFLLFPGIDLWVSRAFFVAGRGFPLSAWPPFYVVHHKIGWVAGAIIAAIAVAAAWLFLLRRPLWRFDARALVFLAAATVLGPGLLANTVLKDHWGRARPSQVEEFGGAHLFTPALVPAAQCQSNCSFVSGDAALGFVLVGFAFLLPAGRQRRRGTAAALGFGALVGLMRIAQGGHFLSDVVFAGFLVYGTTAALWWGIVAHDGPAALAPFCRRVEAAGCGMARRAAASPFGRAAIWTAAATALVVVGILWVDRPIALYLHRRSADLHQLFDILGRLGLGYGYLLGFAAAFAVLHWGGALPRLKPLAAPMRALSAVPAFLFAAIAAAGLAADLLKLVFGRARPKLLFSSDLYGFFWFSLDPRHWSFPSGHTTTIVALMTALWWLWPRHLLFYVLVAAIVAAGRVVGGEHYPSDVVAGALIAVCVTRAVARGFARGGIDLAAAKQGRSGADAAPPWPCRVFPPRLLRRRRV